MTTNTPNLSLVLYDNGVDAGLTFNAFRTDIAGSAVTSNFYKIDTAVGTNITNIGTHTSQIASLMNGKMAVLVSAIRSSPGVYAKTGLTEVVSYVTGMSIILKLDITSTGATTLNINSLGAKSVMKVNTAGTHVDITGGELVAGKYYLFMYDGTRFVWVGATVADQIYITGTSGNFVKVNSDNTLADSTYNSASFIPNDGWIPSTATWSYSSADAPSFVISINADLTNKLTLGMRVKLNQTTDKYFIITKIGTWSGSAQLVTVYGGTDYTLANAAITLPYYSPSKVPFGFDINPDKWTQSYENTTQVNTGVVASGATITNFTGHQLSVPIGLWTLSFDALGLVTHAGAAGLSFILGLSTANNSFTDPRLTATSSSISLSTVEQDTFLSKRDNIYLSAKTTYYLNGNGNTTANTTQYVRGSASQPTTIIAVCAYL